MPQQFFNLDTTGKIPAVYIHDQIGLDWFGEGVSSKALIEEVDALGAITDLDVHIGSPGGNLIDGLNIYNYLKQHKAKIRTFCDSMAGSIASVIFMAGEERFMPVGTEIFVHDPSVSYVSGNAKKLRDVAERLDGVKDNIVNIYVGETGLAAEEVAAMMDAETTLSAEESVDKGFATELVEYDKPVMNNIHADDILLRMQMSADVLVKDQEVMDLKNQLSKEKEKVKNLKAQIKDMPAPPTAAASDEVITQCKEAGMENLAISFIEMKMPLDQVKTALEHAGEIQNICTAVGIDGGQVVMHVNNPVEMLRQALNLQAAEHGDDVSNNLSPETLASGSGKLPSVGAIYAKRKQQTIN